MVNTDKLSGLLGFFFLWYGQGMYVLWMLLHMICGVFCVEGIMGSLGTVLYE